MSIKEKESAIEDFKSQVRKISFDKAETPYFIEMAIYHFSQLSEYFPSLRQTEEYKKMQDILSSLKNPAKKFFLKSKLLQDLMQYSGRLAAIAYEELEKVKPKEPEKIKVEKKIVPVEIPPSSCYKVLEDVSKLSNSLWRDKTIIRNVEPIFKDLIEDLIEAGSPSIFIEELKEYFQFFSSQEGEITIPQLKKLDSSYLPKDSKLKKLLTNIEHYAKKRIEKEKMKKQSYF
jgi:hypothetical protein